MYGKCEACKLDNQLLNNENVCDRCSRNRDTGYTSSDQPVFSSSYDNDSYTSYDSGSFSGGSFD